MSQIISGHCSATNSTQGNQRAHMAYTCVYVCVRAHVCVYEHGMYFKLITPQKLLCYGGRRASQRAVEATLALVSGSSPATLELCPP